VAQSDMCSTRWACNMNSNLRTRVLRTALLVAFAAMVTSTGRSQDVTAPAFKMPPLKKITSVENFYPFIARRDGQQGRVVIELNIDQRGRPVDPVIVESGPTFRFDESARRLVKALLYDVPADWNQSAAGAHRYRLSVKYRPYQCVRGMPCDGKRIGPIPDDPDVDGTIKITTSGGAPVS
jgi:TonB family protein